MYIYIYISSFFVKKKKKKVQKYVMYKVKCVFCASVNKIASQRKTHVPPQRFLYLRETKSWWCEERGGEGEGGEEKVHLLTHTTARGMGKKY